MFQIIIRRTVEQNETCKFETLARSEFLSEISKTDVNQQLKM